MKEIAYASSALKELMAITSADRARIVEKIKQYASDPLSSRNQIKSLKGGKASRLRVPDHRVIFSEEQTRIFVLKVGHRRDVYE